MATTSHALPLIVPGAGGNGNAIANNAATPVVQSGADLHRDNAMTFRIIAAGVHTLQVFGFLDVTSTTLTDGSEMESLRQTSHAATTGNGYTVTAFADHAWAGVACVVTNKSGGNLNIGVDRIVQDS